MNDKHDTQTRFCYEIKPEGLGREKKTVELRNNELVEIAMGLLGRMEEVGADELPGFVELCNMRRLLALLDLQVRIMDRMDPAIPQQIPTLVQGREHYKDKCERYKKECEQFIQDMNLILEKKNHE